MSVPLVIAKQSVQGPQGPQGPQATSQLSSTVSSTATATATAPYVLFSLEDNGQGPRLIRTQLEVVPPELAGYVVDYPLVARSGRGGGSNREVSPAVPAHLRNLAVIDSTTSGTLKSSALYFAVVAPLLQAFGLAHVYVATTSPLTIPSHARSFSSSSTVVFLAGDTSIHEFVNSLQPTSSNLHLTVAAIPTGTGNALSNSIGHDGPAHAISRLFIGTPKPLASAKVALPPGTVTEGTSTQVDHLYSIVVASWAFHASIVADSDEPEARKLGPARFQAAAEHNLKIEQKYIGTVTYKSGGQVRPLNGPHSYVLFTLQSSLEKGFVISPKSAPPSSRNLHLVQFDYKPHNADEIMDIMKAAYDNGRHVTDPRVVYATLEPTQPIADPIATLTITDSDDRHNRVCIDGRILRINSNDPVKIYSPTYTVRGWGLNIIV